MASLFDWFRKPRASRRLFGDAIRHWNDLRSTVHQEQTRHHLLQVVGLCQQSISANPRNGNPYVLLTNALLQGQVVFPTADQNTLDQYASAVIKSWADLPFKSTTASNSQLGKRWYEQAEARLKESGVNDPEGAMADCARQHGALVCSPTGLDQINQALTGLVTDTTEQLQQRTNSEAKEGGFFEFVGANLMRDLLKPDQKGAIGVATEQAFQLVATGFAVGFHLARSDPEKMDQLFWEGQRSIDTEMFEAKLKQRHATGSLTQMVFVKSTFNLAFLSHMPVIDGLRAIQEAAHACMLGMRLGLFASEDSGNVDEEFDALKQEMGYGLTGIQTHDLTQELLKVYEAQFGSIGPTPTWFVEVGIESRPTQGSKREAAGFGGCTECGATLYQISLLSGELEISECVDCKLTHARGRSTAVETAKKKSTEQGQRMIVRIDE